MRDNLAGAIWRFAIFVAVCLVGMFAIFAIFAQLRFQKEDVYHAEFANVTGLRDGDFVRIAGVEVGQVKRISIRPNTIVTVDFTTEPSVVLTGGSKAAVRWDNPLGDRYLELLDGAGAPTRLAPGATIPMSNTEPSLDLDALIGGFRPLFRALDPDQVNALTGQLIEAFQGQGATISSFLAQTAQFTGTLADRDDLIGQVIHNLNVVLGSLAEQNKQFDKAWTSLADLVHGLAARQPDITNGIAYTDAASASIADLLQQARPALKDDVAQSDRVTSLVMADHDYVDNLLQTLPEKYQALSRHGLYGDFFSFYLCDLLLKVNGKGGQPVYVKVAGQDTGEVHAEVKLFSERNPVIIGIIGVAVATTLLVGAVQYKRLPFFDSGKQYSAYFAEIGGLAAGTPVQVSGFKVGQVAGLALDGNRILVTFDVNKDMPLGDRTEAAIKTRTLLGSKVLEITPRGSAPLSAPIPLDRTTPPYELPDALGDLASAVNGLRTDQLSDSLGTLAETFKNTPADLQVAVAGVARFSDTLGKRDVELRSLLDNANSATTVLAQRSAQVGSLIADTNALLVSLQSQSGSLDGLSAHLSALSRQLSGVVADNRAQLRPALDKLNGVLAIVDKHKERLQKVLKLLNAYMMSFGEALSSGPFFKAYLANLLPGQFVQPFVDAAFSDLGVDPNVLLPSQLPDPQVGQPAMPALPAPFPRTGQGGEPNLTVSDAITGNPGDPRYPYREPLPAPPPGGPPPGAPAIVDPIPEVTP